MADLSAKQDLTGQAGPQISSSENWLHGTFEPQTASYECSIIPGTLRQMSDARSYTGILYYETEFEPEHKGTAVLCHPLEVPPDQVIERALNSEGNTALEGLIDTYFRKALGQPKTGPFDALSNDMLDKLSPQKFCYLDVTHAGSLKHYLQARGATFTLCCKPDTDKDPEDCATCSDLYATNTDETVGCEEIAQMVQAAKEEDVSTLFDLGNWQCYAIYKGTPGGQRGEILVMGYDTVHEEVADTSFGTAVSIERQLGIEN